MTHPMQIPVLLCALLATATGAFAQKPEGRADAKADARADASGKSSDSSRSSHTSTHRVVVENGKTVVDERTEDGRVVPSGGARPGGLPLPGGLPAMPALDPEELLRNLREQLDRQLGGALPSIPFDGKRPLDGRFDMRDGKHSASDSAKDSSSSSSSSRDADHKSSDAKGTDAKTSGTKITNSKSSGSKPAPATVEPMAEPPATKGGTLTPRRK